MYSALLKCIVLRTKGEAAEPSASTSEAASRLLRQAKGIKVTRIAQIAQKGVCIDGTSFTKQPRFTNVCSSAHEPYVHRLTDPMFVGL